MKIALHEITSMHATFEEDISAYKQAGWTSFELFLDKADTYIKDHALKDYISQVKKSGLKPVACSGHGIVAFGSAEAIKANEKEFAGKLDLLQAVECPCIVFGGDGPAAQDSAQTKGNTEKELAARDQLHRKNLAHFAAQVAILADMAKPKGVAMALEINWCNMCRSVISAAEVISLANRPNVGLLFDYAHFAQTQSRLSDLDALKGKIFAVHLNDMRNAPPEIRNANMDRVVPGDGALPLREWNQKIESLGFSGWSSVEIFCEDLWKNSALAIGESVMQKCRNVWPEAKF
jgi:2-keto-myo-inositol isomerase